MKFFIVHKKADLLFILIVFMVSLFIVGFSSVRRSRQYGGGQASASLLTAQSILQNRSLNLNAYRSFEELSIQYEYPVHIHNEAIFHYSPIGTSVLSLPFIIPARMFSIDMLNPGQAARLQGCIALLTVSIMAILIYLVARFQFSPLLSAFISALFTYGTSIASSSGAALWNYNYEIIFILCSLILFMQIVIKKKYCRFTPHLLGVSLFLAYLCHPHSLIFIIGVVSVLVFLDSTSAGKIISTLFVFFFLFIIFSTLQYGEYLPPYYQFSEYQGIRSLIKGLYINILSPSRGFFIFSPFLIVVLLMGIVYFRKNIILLSFAWGWLVIRIIAVSLSADGGWDSHVFGPHLLTSAVPSILFIGVITMPYITGGTKKVLWRLLIVLGLVSIGIHTGQGLYNMNSVQWNKEPDISFHENYIFSWRYPQFLSSASALEKRKAENSLQSKNYDAGIVSDTFTDTIRTGQPYIFELEMKNTGAEIWKAEDSLYLRVLNDKNIFTYPDSRIAVSEDVVPGEKYTFIIKMQAPSKEGNYPVKWQMHKNGEFWFGEKLSENIEVCDDAEPSRILYNSELIEHDFPVVVEPGKEGALHVTMKNTGTETWKKAERYSLGARGDTDELFSQEFWRVVISRDVEPGDKYTFTLYKHAPMEEGSYLSEWQMIKEGQFWFGEILSREITISLDEEQVEKEFDSKIKTYKYPYHLEPGKDMQARITVQNTGTETWRGEELIRLGALGDIDELVTSDYWRQAISRDVLPGEKYTFALNIESPMEKGMYSSEWQMLKDDDHWFGEIFQKQVTVSDDMESPDNEYDARVISDAFPSSLNPEQRGQAHVTMKNTGTQTWKKSDRISLGALGDKDAVVSSHFWRVIVSEDVSPGESYNFTLGVHSPTEERIYSSKWQMIKEGQFWFGEILSKEITVSDEVEPAQFLYDAQVISYDFPKHFEPDQKGEVHVTMKNTGTETWREEELISLGALGDADELVTSDYWREVVSNDVRSGETYTFRLLTHTPGEEGKYLSEWQMIKEGRFWFGELFTKKVSVLR